MKKSKTVYLSGPMSGYPNNNFDAFDQFKTLLEEQTEYTVISPADIDRELGYVGDEILIGDDLRTILSEDIKQVLLCDAIALMPGWMESSGARVEAHVAQSIGLEIFTVQVRSGNSLLLNYLAREDMPDGVPQVTTKIGG